MTDAHTAPAETLAPRTVRVETANYVIRSVEKADAGESWRHWLLDANAQRMLNAKPRRLTLPEVRAFIASFDRVKAHLLGIFEKDTGRIVGIRAVYINHMLKEYLVNVLIGEADARGKGARHETRFAMHNFMFEELGMEAARCSILEDNAEMIRTVEKNGWVLQHTGDKPKASGEGAVRLREYRLTRATWRASQAAKAFRDQTA